jgi:hypothetical protein
VAAAEGTHCATGTAAFAARIYEAACGQFNQTYFAAVSGAAQDPIRSGFDELKAVSLPWGSTPFGARGAGTAGEALFRGAYKYIHGVSFFRLYSRICG